MSKQITISKKEAQRLLADLPCGGAREIKEGTFRIAATIYTIRINPIKRLILSILGKVNAN